MKAFATTLLFAALLMPAVAFAGAPAFKVGVSVPPSGPLAGIGAAVQNGIQLAREQSPSAFEALDFVFDDNRYDARSALAFFEKSTENRISYVWGSPTCMAVVPAAEKQRRPLVCFSGDAKPGLSYVMSFNNPASDYAALMLSHLRSRPLSRLAIVYSNIPFYAALADSLEASGKNAGAEIRRHSLLPDAQEFATLVTKLKADGDDALALILLSSQLPAFTKQMATLGYRPFIIGVDNFADIDPKHMSGVLEDAAYVDMQVPARFADAYSAKHHDTSNITFAYNGYRFALLMSDIATSAQPSEGAAALLDRLRKHREGREDLAALRFEDRPGFGQLFAFPIELKRIGSPPTGRR